jgi:hypothetical protein
MRSSASSTSITLWSSDAAGSSHVLMLGLRPSFAYNCEQRLSPTRELGAA